MIKPNPLTTTLPLVSVITNGLPQNKTIPSKLFLTSCLEPRDEIDFKFQHCYAILTSNTSNLTEREIHDTLNGIVCKGSQQYEEISLGLLYTILTEPLVCQRAFRDLMLISRDGLNLVLTKINQIVCEKWQKLTECGTKQILWFTNECVRNAVLGIDSVFFYLVRQMVTGDLTPKNIWLIETVLDMLRENYDWLSKIGYLVPFVLYTYLRFVEDHYIPALTPLRAKETEFCVKLLRNHFGDCMVIGRDLVRLLQSVARIPEFDAIWQDIIYKPQVFIPNTPNILQKLLMTRTPRKFITSRITPDLENKITFMLNKVRLITPPPIKSSDVPTSPNLIPGSNNPSLSTSSTPPQLNNLRRYQEWLIRSYDLTNPKRASLICDMIRFICCVIHPNNEILCSDITQRWTIIGWLLMVVAEGKVHNVVSHQPQHYLNAVGLSQCKTALFYDWLGYDPKRDSIMNVEPSILVCYHSLRTHPAMAQSLLEFLCLVSRDYATSSYHIPLNGAVAAGNGGTAANKCTAVLTELSDFVRDNTRRCLKDILDKRVIPSLDPILKFENLDKEVAYLIKETFAIGDTINPNSFIKASSNFISPEFKAINDENQGNNPNSSVTTSYNLPLTPPRSTESPTNEEVLPSILSKSLGNESNQNTLLQQPTIFKRRRLSKKTEDEKVTGNESGQKTLTTIQPFKQVNKRIAAGKSHTSRSSITKEQTFGELDDLEEGRFSESEDSLSPIREKSDRNRLPDFAFITKDFRVDESDVKALQERAKLKLKILDKHLKAISNPDIKRLLRKMVSDGENFRKQIYTHVGRKLVGLDNLEQEEQDIAASKEFPDYQNYANHRDGGQSESTDSNLLRHLKSQTDTLTDILKQLFTDNYATSDVKSFDGVMYCLSRALKPYLRNTFNFHSPFKHNLSNIFELLKSSDSQHRTNTKESTTSKKGDKSQPSLLFKSEWLKMDYEALPLFNIVSQLLSRQLCPTKTNARVEIRVLLKICTELDARLSRFGYWFIYVLLVLYVRCAASNTDTNADNADKEVNKGDETENSSVRSNNQKPGIVLDPSGSGISQSDFLRCIAFKTKNYTRPSLGEFLSLYTEMKTQYLDRFIVNSTNSLNPCNSSNTSKNALTPSYHTKTIYASFYQDLHQCFTRDLGRFKFVFSLILPALSKYFWDPAISGMNEKERDSPWIKFVQATKQIKNNFRKRSLPSLFEGDHGDSSDSENEKPPTPESNSTSNSSTDEPDGSVDGDGNSDSISHSSRVVTNLLRTRFYRDLVRSLFSDNVSRLMLSHKCRDRCSETLFWADVYNFQEKFEGERKTVSNNEVYVGKSTKKSLNDFTGYSSDEEAEELLAVVGRKDGPSRLFIPEGDSQIISGAKAIFAFNESATSNANVETFNCLIGYPINKSSVINYSSNSNLTRNSVQRYLSEFYDSCLVKALFRVRASTMADIIEDSLEWDHAERRLLWELLDPMFVIMFDEFVNPNCTTFQQVTNPVHTSQSESSLMNHRNMKLGDNSIEEFGEIPLKNRNGFYRFLLQNDVLDIEFEEDTFAMYKIITYLERLQPDLYLVKALLKRENEFAVTSQTKTPASSNQLLKNPNLYNSYPLPYLNFATAAIKCWSTVGASNVHHNNLEYLAEVFATLLNSYIDPRYRPKNLSSTRIKEPLYSDQFTTNPSGQKVSKYFTRFINNSNLANYNPTLETLLTHLDALRISNTVFFNDRQTNATADLPSNNLRPSYVSLISSKSSLDINLSMVNHAVPLLLKHDLVRFALLEVKSVCPDYLRTKFRHLFTLVENLVDSSSSSSLEKRNDSDYHQGSTKPKTLSGKCDDSLVTKLAKSNFGDEKLRSQQSKRIHDKRLRYDNIGMDYDPSEDLEIVSSEDDNQDLKEYEGSSVSSESETNLIVEEKRLLQEIGSASISSSEDEATKRNSSPDYDYRTLSKKVKSKRSHQSPDQTTTMDKKLRSDHTNRTKSFSKSQNKQDVIRKKKVNNFKSNLFNSNSSDSE